MPGHQGEAIELRLDLHLHSPWVALWGRCHCRPNTLNLFRKRMTQVCHPHPHQHWLPRCTAIIRIFNFIWRQFNLDIVLWLGSATKATCYHITVPALPLPLTLMLVHFLWAHAVQVRHIFAFNCANTTYTLRDLTHDLFWLRRLLPRKGWVVISPR